MHRIRAKKVAELTQGSTKSTMGEPWMASNKLAYSGHQELPISTDVFTSGQPARGLLLGDLDLLRSLRSLWFITYPCNPCVPSTAGPVPNKYFSLWSLCLRGSMTRPKKTLRLTSWRKQWN